MPLKIISGIIQPQLNKLTSGEIILSLSDGTPTSTRDATFAEKSVIGTGAYLGKPSVTLALRHIKVYELDTDTDTRVDDGTFPQPQQDYFVGVTIYAKEDFLPDNNSPHPTAVKVLWRTQGVINSRRLAEIYQISILIIGESS